jgi:hypothetical protein
MGEPGSSSPRFGALATRFFERARLDAETSMPKSIYGRALGLGGGVVAGQKWRRGRAPQRQVAPPRGF